MLQKASISELLQSLSEQVGSGYLVRSLAEGRSCNLEDVVRKIQISGAKAVVLSPGVDNDDVKALREKIELPFIQQIEDFPITQTADFYEIVVSSGTEGFSNFLSSPLLKQSYFVFRDLTDKDFTEKYSTILKSGAPYFFEFSDYSTNDAAPSAAQVYNFMRDLHERKIQVRTPPGRPRWDNSIPKSLELEPLVPISFQMGTSEGCEFSVVVPTYNSKHFLLNVLRHLSRQDISQDCYEVIVVDDGSSDGSLEYIRGHFERHKELKNLKYIYFSRPQNRQRGDSFFRAGISRNLGVSKAVGKYVTFLDSDILVPENFFSDLRHHLKNWDVIQNVRFHLLPKISNEFIRFENVVVKSQTFIEEKHYWQPFFESPSWHSLTAFWKYTCTYCLTVKKEDFLNLGRFRRNFVSYGFEDTDLGYRFYKAGKKFYLSKNFTLHLTPDKTGSEYRNSQIHRQILLSKTAKKFFLNNLDTYIYEHLNIYMGGEYPLARKAQAQIKSLFRR